MSDDLQDLLQDLIHAQSAAPQVAASVIATGKAEAATGIKLPGIPGPALQAALAGHTGTASGSATASSGAVAGIASHVAKIGADALVKLLAGG